MRDGRAAEPNTDLMKTLEIAIGQIGEALADVIDGLIHPMRLVVQCSLQDTTAIDMAKQLITCSVQEFLFTQVSLRLLFVCARIPRAS
jgi:hypothetical protein